MKAAQAIAKAGVAVSLPLIKRGAMYVLRVIAKSGCACPREDPRSGVIKDDAAVEVPNTAYYRRRIADGSLLLSEPDKDDSPTSVSVQNGGAPSGIASTKKEAKL